MINSINVNENECINISLEVADNILSQLENAYKHEFYRNFGHIEENELRKEVCLKLKGITYTELKRGLKQIKFEKQCPSSISEFRYWCDGEMFWSASHAWAMATQYLNNPKIPITVFTKIALDNVMYILQNEGQKSAGFAFKDIYKSLIHDAFTRDQRQEFWHKEAKSFKPIVGNSNTRFEEGMTEEIKKICEYQNEFMAQGVLPKVAFDRARLEVL